MEPDFVIQEIIQATTRAFREISAKRSHIKPFSTLRTPYHSNTSCYIKVSGTMQGFIVICFPMGVAARFVKHYLGSMQLIVDDGLLLGTYQICEKILSSIDKGFLLQHDLLCNLSRGLSTKEQSIRAVTPRIVVPGTSTLGNFHLESYLQKVTPSFLYEHNDTACCII